jgi:5'-deoxynucleotidase YfbR-like HD superfamily hydrolase
MIHSILLQSGGLFNFDDPEGSTFTIHDVAHNLSHICRFNGGCDVFFAVAQHSNNVSVITGMLYAELTEPHPLTREELEREAQAHDAAEAFYGDMTTWLKALCPDYRAQLGRGENAVADRLGLRRGMDPIVKKADYIALALERRAFFKNIKLAAGEDGFHHLKDVSPDELERAALLVDMTPMRPRVAKLAFLERWEELNSYITERS